MKFKINRDHFSNALQQVMNVVGARAAIPVLSNALIEAEGDTVSLTTTNLDLGIRCKAKAEVSMPGKLTLPARKLFSIVRELPNLDVVVDASSGNTAKISSGKSIFRMMGIDSEEFPPLPTFADKRSFILSQSDLARMLKSVSYAQSKDETRYIMNGVYFNFEDAKLTLAATDGRRLAVISKELEVTEENAGSLILPEKTVNELERLLGQGDTVRIAFNDRQAAFEVSAKDDDDESGIVEAVHLVSKVAEGAYPNYRQVIPRDTDLHIKLNRESLYNCIHQASLMASDKNNSVKLSVAKDKLEITGSSPDIGDSSVTLDIEYDGPEVAVAFNPQFMKDPLKALDRDEVIFAFKDELSPGVFRTPESFLCVIMPLRLS